MPIADSEKEKEAIIDKAMESGVRFFENAWVYHGGEAEEIYGRYLVPKYRDEIFLATKNRANDAEGARKQHEDSKRRMKTDVIDLVYMHNLYNPDDVDKRLNGGVLEFLLKMQQKGEIRHLGFSGHTHTVTHTHFIEKIAGNDPFVATLFPVNPVEPSKPDSFVKELLPWLQDTGYALIGMKSLAHGRFMARNHEEKWRLDDPVVPNYLSVEEVLWYALSLPITSLVVGTEKLEYLEQNVRAVEAFQKFSRSELEEIEKRVARFASTPNLEYYRPYP